MTEVTLDTLEHFAKTSPRRSVSFRTLTWSAGVVPNYNEFAETVQTAAVIVCGEIAFNPQLRANFSEDEITIQVVSGLKLLGLDASFETTVGGHCDVTVKLQDLYLWLAEAKILRDNGWLWQGYQQLVTRYSPGQAGTLNGGMLIYCYKPRLDQLMATWRERLQQEDGAIVIGTGRADCACSFTSTSQNQRTGASLDVLHIPMSLYFDPRDKH